MVYNQLMVEQKSTYTFSIKEAVKFGWEVTKKHFWFLFAFIVIIQAFSYGLSYFQSSLMENNDNSLFMIGILAYLAGMVINIELGYAQESVFLKLVDKQKAAFKDLYSYFDVMLLLRYVGLSILLSFIVFLGMLLFIIPGIYFALKYRFAMNVFIAKQGKVGFMEALHESAKLTEGIKWQLLRFGIIEFLIVLAGFLVFIVGLFVAIPVVGIADFYLYRKLSATK